MASFKSDVDTIRMVNLLMENLGQRLQTLTNERNDAAQELAQSQQENERLSREVTQLQQFYQQDINHYAQLKEENKQLKDKNKALKDKNRDLEDQLDEAVEDLLTVKTKLKVAMASVLSLLDQYGTEDEEDEVKGDEEEEDEDEEGDTPESVPSRYALRCIRSAVHDRVSVYLVLYTVPPLRIRSDIWLNSMVYST